MLMEIISWSATILSLAGNYLLVKKDWRGYILFTMANAFLIGFAISIGNYAQIVMYLAFTGFNIAGIRSWRRETKTV